MTIGIGFAHNAKVADGYAENLHRYGTDELRDRPRDPRLLEQALVNHAL